MENVGWCCSTVPFSFLNVSLLFHSIRNIKKLINGYRIALVIFNIGKFIIEGKHTYYMFNPSWVRNFPV